MVRNYRRKKRHDGSWDAFKSFLTVILLLVVFAETMWLVRIYHPGMRFYHKPSRVRTSLGKIAVIVDDNGYSSDDCMYLSRIDAPVAVSVLPELPYSKAMDACAAKNNKEVMLHLPLEPYQNRQKYAENYIIKTSMPPDLIVQKFNEALSGVPHAKGINNHMGSKATEDTGTMSVIFTEMKKNNLYFVDSRVTAKSICRFLAQKRNLPFAERDVFLDNENDRAYIEQQFRELEQKARKKGYAIGIGHARPLTWEIIKEQSERLTAQGFEFVTVKSIIDSL